ncbi:hypothetical protein ACFYUR_18900 [Micromonospora haikouensis]|uniref:hypothetical protein n=1 Tax=Micromonospora haikouensis TaxID=686309 RepID=UPI003675FF66
MTDTTATQPPAAAPTSPRQQRTTTRPTVSVRPVAVGAVNAATIAGATAVAAGGGIALAALAGGAALAATAAGARKTGHAKANKAATGSPFRNPARSGGSPGGGGGGRSGGGMPRAGRSGAASPGGRAPGSKPSPTPRAGGRPSSTGSTNGKGGGLLSKVPGLGKSTPTGSRTPGGSRNSNPGSGRRTTPTGHRPAGSQPGSSSRSPLTADKVAAARRRLANRRQPGPRLSDAIHKATQPGTDGKKPTARQAWRAARQQVTGMTPKNRGALRRALAGLTAAALAAAKAGRDNRNARKRREAARQALDARRAARLAAAQHANRTAVARTIRQRPGTPTNPNTHTHSNSPAVKPAPITPIVAAKPATVTATGGTVMSRQLLAISEDFLSAAARNQPDGMLQVTAEAHLMPQILDNLSRALKLRYDQALKQPMHPAIKDMYGEIHKNQVAVASASEEIGPTIERVHKDELERLRNPLMRGDESMWDTVKNRDVA